MKESTTPFNEQKKPKEKPRPSKPLPERREKFSPGPGAPCPHQGPPKDKPKPGKPD